MIDIGRRIGNGRGIGKKIANGRGIGKKIVNGRGIGKKFVNGIGIIGKKIVNGRIGNATETGNESENANAIGIVSGTERRTGKGRDCGNGNVKRTKNPRRNMTETGRRRRNPAKTLTKKRIQWREKEVGTQNQRLMMVIRKGTDTYLEVRRQNIQKTLQ